MLELRGGGVGILLDFANSETKTHSLHYSHTAVRVMVSPMLARLKTRTPLS